MPTTRPRHTITETDDVARALDIAEQMWPELSGDRSRLLRRILEQGITSVQQSAAETIARRRLALDTLSGSLRGPRTADERRTLLEEWPE